jgi:hypothetical protein
VLVPAGAEEAAEAAPKPRPEILAMRAEFVSACLALAEKAADSDPGLARRAARFVQRVAPDDAGAKAILERVGSGADTARDSLALARDRTHVPAWVASWRDLLADGSFGEEGKAGPVRLAAGESSYARPHRAVETGPRYVVEADLRMVRATGGGGAMLGLVFGTGGAGSLSVFLSGGRVIVDEDLEGRIAVLRQADTTAASPGGWHRIALVVDEGKVTVWHGGQPLIARATPRDADLSGDLAVLRAHCEVEVRWLRVGTPP